MWSNVLHPWPGSQGHAMASPPLRILFPRGPRPVHSIEAVTMPLFHSANHHLPRHFYNRERRPPPPTDLLSTVRWRQPPCHCHRLGPLGLHANVQPNAAVRVQGWWRGIQQENFLQANISHFFRPILDQDREETSPNDTLWRHRPWHNT